MKHQRSSQQVVRLAFWLIVVMGCIVYASASAASLSARTPVRTRTPAGLARKTATPTRKHLPPGLAKKTGTPTATSTPIPPWTGSVLINGGICCVGGCAGEVVHLHIALSASSPFDEVVEMRVKKGLYGFTDEEWEPFAPVTSYPWTIIPNWAPIRINAQFRDQGGNLSPVYWDDIQQEGMGTCPPVTPSVTSSPWK